MNIRNICKVHAPNGRSRVWCVIFEYPREKIYRCVIFLKCIMGMQKGKKVMHFFFFKQVKVIRIVTKTNRRRRCVNSLA